MQKIVISTLLATFMISGCSLIPKSVAPVEVRTIAEMQLVDVEFEILTPELMAEYLALVDEGKAPARPYYALTTQQYENLSTNMAEITRYTNNIISIIKYYREYDKQDEVDETGNN